MAIHAQTVHERVMMNIKFIGILVFFWALTVVLCIELGFMRGQDSERLSNAKSIIKIRDITDNNNHIVYKTIVESQTVYVDKVRTVKEYIHAKKDYTDTRCIPVAGLLGYNASLYNANSSRDPIGELFATKTFTDSEE